MNGRKWRVIKWSGLWWAAPPTKGIRDAVIFTTWESAYQFAEKTARPKYWITGLDR